MKNKPDLSYEGALIWIAVLGLFSTIVSEVAYVWRDERKYRRKQEKKAAKVV